MNSKLFLFSLLILVSFIQCKEECTDIFEPVCGSDNRNYINACKARTARINFTEGLCTAKSRGSVLSLGEGKDGGCGWVIQIDSFSLNLDREVYFTTDKLSGEFQENGLRVEITHTGFSDALGSCYYNGLNYYLLYASVVDIIKI